MRLVRRVEKYREITRAQRLYPFLYGPFIRLMRVAREAARIVLVEDLKLLKKAPELLFVESK